MPCLAETDIVRVMSFEFAYRFPQDALPASFKELDGVTLLSAVVGDEGERLPAGAEGTIVSTHGMGESFVVEFAEPSGALATVLPDQIRLTVTTGR